MTELSSNQVSAAQSRLPSPQCNPSVDIDRAIAAAEADLRPAETKTLLAELAACLTLVAPSGSSANDRSEWLKVAAATLAEARIPAPALREACSEARTKCRFASELVPFIIDAAKPISERLHGRIRSLKWQRDHPPVPPSHQIAKVEDRPFTIDELRRMHPRIRAIGERQGWIEADMLAQVRAEEDEARRQAATGG